MGVGKQQSLEGQLASRALQTVVPGAIVLSGLEAISTAARAANIASILAQTKSDGSHGTRGVIVSWRTDSIAARHARTELERWLGGLPVPAGLTQDDAAAIEKALSGWPHRLVVEHGSLRSWQLVHFYDALTTLAAEPMPELAAAREALTAGATIAGRHGPTSYRTVILSSAPIDASALTRYVADADEQLLDAAPALIHALQNMYLAGYVQRRDLDTVRGEKARLMQALADVNAQAKRT